MLLPHIVQRNDGRALTRCFPICCSISPESYRYRHSCSSGGMCSHFLFPESICSPGCLPCRLARLAAQRASRQAWLAAACPSLGSLAPSVPSTSSSGCALYRERLRASPAYHCKELSRVVCIMSSMTECSVAALSSSMGRSNNLAKLFVQM